MLEQFVATIAGPSWRAVTDHALIQGDAVAVALWLGYCERHAIWLGDLVGMFVTDDADRRRSLARVAIAPEGR